MKILPYTVTDLSALVHNARLLKKLAGDFYCVVKCRAYGHGDTECVSALYSAGMRRFAVSDITEALRIRPLAPDAEIVVLGACDVSVLPLAAENSFTLTIHDEYEAAGISKKKADKLPLPEFHIKLDTGMHRSGFECDPETVFRSVYDLNNNITGIYTHFPRADADDISETEAQLRLFNEASDTLSSMFDRPLIRHTAASPAFFRLPAENRGLCRIGLALYGVPPEHFPDILRESEALRYNPSGVVQPCANGMDNESEAFETLKPVMSFCSEVSGIRTVKSGEYIGYGSVFRCDGDKVIATVAGGYANGILRYLKNPYPIYPSVKGRADGTPDTGKAFKSDETAAPTCCAEINGYPAALAGTPCMDRCMFDVTPIFKSGGKISPGDRVVFFGESRSVNEYARALGTISYEALTTVGNLNYKKIR